MNSRLAARPSTVLRCALCHDDLGAARWTCEVCSAAMHEQCARGLGRCSTLGCTARVPEPRPRPRPASRLTTLVPWVSGVLTLLWPLWMVAVWRLHYLVAGPYSTHVMDYRGPDLGTLLVFLVGSLAVGPAVGHLVLAPRARDLGVPGRHHRRALGGWLTGLAASVGALLLLVFIMQAR